jgi:hypothetical protein
MNQRRFDRRIQNWRGPALAIVGGGAVIALVVAFATGRSEQQDPAPAPPPTTEPVAEGHQTNPVGALGVAAPPATTGGSLPLGGASAPVASRAGETPAASDLGGEFRTQLTASPAFARMQGCLAKRNAADAGDAATVVDFTVAGNGSIASVHAPNDLSDCLRNAARGFAFRARGGSAGAEFSVSVPVAGR